MLIRPRREERVTWCAASAPTRPPFRLTCSDRHAAPSFTRRGRRRAHRNSVARIARPSGTTVMAGPGSTVSTTPTTKVVTPITATTTFRATRSVADGEGVPAAAVTASLQSAGPLAEVTARRAAAV